jgi:hypothetical protein
VAGFSSAQLSSTDEYRGAARLPKREAMALGRLPELYLVDAFQDRACNHAKAAIT